MNASKAAVGFHSLVGHLLSIAGYFVGSTFLLAFITGFAGAYDESYANEAIILSALWLILCVAAVVTGARIVVTGARIKRRIHRFRQYVALMSLQKLTSIDDIAASTSRSADFVKKDLQKMIRRRFFVNASIDEAANQIIVCAHTLPVQGGSVEYEVFHCSGCGASGSKEKDKLGHCDYCGSPVQ